MNSVRKNSPDIGYSISANLSRLFYIIYVYVNSYRLTPFIFVGWFVLIPDAFLYKSTVSVLFIYSVCIGQCQLVVT